MRRIRNWFRPAVIVGVLVGLAIGVPTGLGLLRGFDPGFRAAFVGALIGGALAVVGGYLGSKELIGRDDQRERKDLIGAVQVARSEIATNSAVIDDMIQKQFVNFAEVHLYDADYRQVITTLARGLRMDLFADLSVTFNRLRHAAVAVDRDVLTGRGIHGGTVNELTALAEDLHRVNGKLLDYAKDTLRLEIPEQPQNPFP